MKIKRDKYLKQRGGTYKIYEIYCNCGQFLCNYQKDGKGVLYRLYLDRISDSTIESLKTKNKKSYWCRKCGSIFGTEMIFEKEKRKAIRRRFGKIQIDIV